MTSIDKLPKLSKEYQTDSQPSEKQSKQTLLNQQNESSKEVILNKVVQEQIAVSQSEREHKKEYAQKVFVLIQVWFYFVLAIVFCQGLFKLLCDISIFDRFEFIALLGGLSLNSFLFSRVAFSNLFGE